MSTKQSIRELIRTKDASLPRAMLALEKNNMFHPDHAKMLKDLCNWYREYGYYTRPQRENIRKHLLDFYVPTLTSIANKGLVKAPTNTVKTEKPTKEEKAMKKDATKKETTKKELTYEEKWSKLAADLEAAEAEFIERKNARIDAFVAKHGLPAPALAKLEKLVSEYGFAGIDKGLEQIAEKHGLTIEREEEVDEPEEKPAKPAAKKPAKTKEPEPDEDGDEFDLDDDEPEEKPKPKPKPAIHRRK